MQNIFKIASNVKLIVKKKKHSKIKAALKIKAKEKVKEFKKRKHLVKIRNLKPEQERLEKEEKKYIESIVTKKE